MITEYRVVIGENASAKVVTPGIHSIRAKEGEDPIVGIYINVETGEMVTYSRKGILIPERDGFYASQDEKETSNRRCVCCYVYFPK